VSDPARLRNTLFDFHSLAASRDNEMRLWMSHLLHELVYQCVRRYRLSAAMPPASDLLMEQARKLLQENYKRADLSLAVVAHSLGLTAVQLTRRFRSAYSQVPSEYLTGLRLDRALTLLLNTRMSLAEIAQDCGYRDAFYLSRVFKSAYGLAPAHYRQLHCI
jgi:transcriptional regulator GlxA family with amidase domain